MRTASVNHPSAVASAPRVVRDWPDLAARACTGALLLMLAFRIAQDFADTQRFTGLLLLASELLVVIFTVVRRRATTLDRSLDARIVTGLSILGPLLIRPVADAGLVVDTVTAPISAAGLAIVIAGKMTLGRSFGIMPAHRGIVRSGPYRLVRHPIYLGYLVTHVAFLAAHATSWNVAVLTIADLALLVRARYEERTLACDPAYVDYAAAVRWRVVPHVY